jgi:hypothetical protein
MFAMLMPEKTRRTPFSRVMTEQLNLKDLIDTGHSLIEDANVGSLPGRSRIKWQQW